MINSRLVKNSILAPNRTQSRNLWHRNEKASFTSRNSKSSDSRFSISSSRPTRKIVRLRTLKRMRSTWGLKPRKRTKSVTSWPLSWNAKHRSSTLLRLLRMTSWKSWKRSGLRRNNSRGICRARRRTEVILSMKWSPSTGLSTLNSSN